MRNLNQKIETCKEYGNIANAPYRYKMGGITKVVITKKGNHFHSLEFDDRKYYEGRGSKYNGSINHDYIEEIISFAEFKRRYREAKAYFKNREKQIKARAASEKLKEQRYQEFKSKGLYEVEKLEHGTFVCLSDSETYGKTFDEERLAKTLNISLNDARLLRSTGKTYVFAKQLDTGKTIELYHASLSCNPLNISISYPSPERIEEFQNERNNWENAPYAHHLGMTSNENHFVC